MKTKLSRREFLAGVGATVGATGLAAASAGLVGCTSINTLNASASENTGTTTKTPGGRTIGRLSQKPM